MNEGEPRYAPAPAGAHVSCASCGRTYHADELDPAGVCPKCLPPEEDQEAGADAGEPATPQE